MTQSHADPSRSELHVSTRIVYDKTSGDIVHVHQAVWRPDREPPPSSAIDADARRNAAKIRKCAEDTLDVLPVDFDKFDIKVAYSVDLRTKQLVKKP